MAVITMQSITSLIFKIKYDYPDYTFVESDTFYWSPSTNSIYYSNEDDPIFLLHELSHALLNHSTYKKDIELVEMECAAWSHTLTILSIKYGIDIKTNLVEDILDTYRDWLHARSKCPSCNAIGIEIKKTLYKCPSCNGKWQVNDARVKELRRKKIIQQ